MLSRSVLLLVPFAGEPVCLLDIYLRLICLRRKQRDEVVAALQVADR